MMVCSNRHNISIVRLINNAADQKNEVNAYTQHDRATLWVFMMEPYYDEKDPDHIRFT